MLLANLATSNPVYFSLDMTLLGIVRALQGTQLTWCFLYLFPAFVGSLARMEDVPWFLGVCDAFRHFGTYSNYGRYKVQLSEGDLLTCAMANCFRTQYPYSHAPFRNA